MRNILILGFIVLSANLFGQKVENIKAEVLGDGEKVVITYDITGALEGQRFKVTLYGSHNNFAAPLSLVSGDVGRDRELSGGPSKRIEWSAKSELKEYSGDITFEVRAEIVASLFISSPSLGAKFKKGKVLDITWQGGTPGESMRLDLLKGGAVITQIASVQNSQKFSWAVPKSVAKGGDYQVRLTAESGTAMSGNFGIKPKTSFGLIMLPVLAVGGGVAYLVTRDKPEKEKDLPLPPEPTN